MKKILYILFSICLLTACSSDDPISDDGDSGNNGGATQNYTGLVVLNETRSPIPTLIIAYHKDSKYYQIKKVLNLEIGSKTEELTISETNLNDIFIFTSDIFTGDYYRTTEIISLNKNRKNDFKYTPSIKATKVNDINDPSQFPF